MDKAMLLRFPITEETERAYRAIEEVAFAEGERKSPVPQSRRELREEMRGMLCTLCFAYVEKHWMFQGHTDGITQHVRELESHKPRK